MFQKIELEILEYSYWEHFKKAKDLRLILPLDHPTMLDLESTCNDLIERINLIKNSLENKKKG